MKILQISSVPINYSGGAEKVIRDSSKELVKKNEVTVLQTNLYIQEKKSSIEIKNDIKIITCKNDYFFGGMGYSKEFKKKLKKIWKSYDVVHIHGHGRFTSLYSLWFLKNKLPIVYTPHGFFHTKKAAFIKRIHDFFFYKLIKQSKFCIALTRLEKEKFLDIGVDKNSIVVIPNFIKLKEFKLKKNRVKFLKSLGLDSKRKTILCLGRVHESKGLDYVVDAIKDLDVNLIIAGKDAGLADKLKEKVKMLDLENKVKIIGEVSNKKKLQCYANSDVFVLFSEWEGFGIVMIEAMASGLPVIVSDRGPLPDIVKDGENGLVARFRDVGELEKKIKMLVGDKKIYNKIKKNEVNFVKQFDTKKIVRQIEELYEKAIRK